MSLAFTSISEAPIAVATTRLDANAFVGSVLSTFQAGTLDYDAKASSTITSATSTFIANTFDDIDAKATTNALTPVTATLANTFGGIANSTTLSGTSSTTSVGTLSYDAKANTTAATIQAVFALDVEYSAKANITLDTASASADLTVNVTDFEEEDAQGTVTLSGVSATTSANWDTVNGIYTVQVIYLATDFERTRTVNIVPYGNNTVYVTR